ncbi:MAG: DUF302 domain-containing protein [Calditrichaeota bacterium]|nr:MAG: DUF302 domain-containing protein [Calditrichota bacterium]
MSYYISKKLNCSFEEAIDKVTAALASEGFGILTEINVNETLKKKLNVDFYRYQILGACNPPLAYEALQSEDKIGVMLPCNFIVQEKIAGKIEVSAVNPTSSMSAVKNDNLAQIAQNVQQKLQTVIDKL